MGFLFYSFTAPYSLHCAESTQEVRLVLKIIIPFFVQQTEKEKKTKINLELRCKHHD